MNPVEPQYATWDEPETSQVVKYSLPLFHELDFQVNEAYRRIPHGGVEIGGVLYGRADSKAISIEAFRPIECDHAAGPSFNLSEVDLAKMVQAFELAKTDGELKGLERVGWFVSHTRSAPEMTAREMQIFERYFPGPDKLTLLVKPERFQPTHFVFCPRRPDGQTSRGNPIILPLVGRAGSSSPVLSSIAAPVKREAVRERERSTIGEVRGELPEAPSTALTDPAKSGSEAMPSIEEIRRRRSEHLRSSLGDQAWRTKFVKTEAPRSSPAGGSLILILVLASLLGCAAGYWTYLQLPAATIPLRVEKTADGLLIWWPPEQTRDSNLPAIRIDDGQAVSLTDQQKTAGQIRITPTSENTKIELIAHHPLRDSRGIVRYVRSQPHPPPAPAAKAAVPEQ